MASSQAPLKRRLQSLECHFTWNLSDSKRNTGLVLGRLKAVRERGKCSREGHLYNLLGYYYHIKDSTEEALAYLQKAEEILREQEPEGRGPRLLVNQANLAWVHYLLEELTKSETYLKNVSELQRDFPAPPGCELHPEVYGEKAWTQMQLEYDEKKKAIANFKSALRGDPNRKEWNTGLALAKYRVYYGSKNKSLNEEIIEQIKHAKEIDPDNLHMSVLYLVSLAAVGKKTDETMKEAYELFQQIKPDSNAFEDLFHFFRVHDSTDKALQLAEEAVRIYPSEKCAKKQLSLCYRRKIFQSQGNVDQELMTKAIEISEEVSRLYPYNCRSQSSLAGLYAISGNIEKAEEIYKDLLSKEEDLEPLDLQQLYYRYAKHLNNCNISSFKSLEYHKKVAEIQVNSWEREDSIKILTRIVSNHNHPRCDEILDFLTNLMT